MILIELRNAWRRLRARPGYSLLTVGILGLGLGAVLFLLGAVNGMMLRPLPYADADRLMALGAMNRDDVGVNAIDSEDVPALRTALQSFEAIGVYSSLTVNLQLPGGPRRYDGGAFSAEVLPLLGVAPALGQAITPVMDQPGAAPVVLLSHSIWRDDFGADPGVLGRTLRVNGVPGTIIGVMPEGFGFPYRQQVWVARRMVPGDDFGAELIGRLKSGVSLAMARQELEAAALHLGQTLELHRDGGQLTVKPLTYRLVNERARSRVGMMFVAGALVLLLACVNVASLQLAQVLTRGRELAILGALGAGRRRLLREWLLESLLLSLLATALALVAAEYGGRWIMRVLIAADDAPAAHIHFGVDLAMVGYAAVIALLTTLLAGLVPAWRAARLDVQSGLRDGARDSGGGFARMARGLVVAEIALTVLLLMGAGAYIIGLQRVLAFDFGTRTDPGHIATGRVALFPEQFPQGADQVAFFERVAERLRQLPGVRAVGAASGMPGQDAGDQLPVTAAGVGEPEQGWPRAMINHADDGFLAAYGIGLVSGRWFDGRDQADSAPVAVVDERTAAALWPGRDPVGQTVLTDPASNDERALTVVGVIRSTHMQDADDPIHYNLMLPLRQHPRRFVTLAVATEAPAEAFLPVLAATVAAEDPGTPVYWQRTHATAIAQGRVGAEILTRIFTGTGLLALLLAASGLYGVLAFAVNQRRRELAVRRAVGADGVAVTRAVTRRIGWQVGIGLLAGVVLSVPWAGLLEDPDMQVPGFQPLLVAAAVGVILLVAALASLLPIRRALSVQPVLALRGE